MVLIWSQTAATGSEAVASPPLALPIEGATFGRRRLRSVAATSAGAVLGLRATDGRLAAVRLLSLRVRRALKGAVFQFGVAAVGGSGLAGQQTAAGGFPTVVFNKLWLYGGGVDPIVVEKFLDIFRHLKQSNYPSWPLFITKAFVTL